ncbi:MAG: A24 family peptidase [Lachnospiraceae bacterium]|nr:A24 family peptidase [Lachnospiraceae bacterium]
MIAGLFFFLVLAVILDLRTYRIPNVLTMAGMAVGVIYQLYRAGPPGMFGAVKDLIGSILILFPLYIIRCLGAGDIKLLSVVTVFLGWKQGMTICIYSLFVGAAMGIIKGSILFVLRRKNSVDQQILKVTKQQVMKNLGKEVIFYSAGKSAKMTFLFDEKFKKLKKGVADSLQRKFILRQKNHIEQIRNGKRYNKNMQKDQIGEIKKISYMNHMDRTEQMHHKEKAGEQRCVIHYSIAILIAFLIVRIS